MARFMLYAILFLAIWAIFYGGDTDPEYYDEV